MADVPFVLEGIEPIRRLGGGGFGEVWLSRQTNIDRMVAVKVGHAPIDNKTIQLRFERECIALGRLSGHPNIIDVFTAGQMTDGRPYLVLEYVSGGTMWDRLQQSPLGESELIKAGTELAGALAVAHQSGVLHRDLKPENLLLRPNGEVVLGDFGIARLQDGANTTSHAITASVAYAAPEILSGSPPSVASDVYGIGVCLLAGVLRKVPFVEKTDESIHPIINRVLTNDPPDLRGHGISEELSSLMTDLLHKKPDQRPPSADAVRDRLLSLRTGHASSSQSSPAGRSDGAPTAHPTKPVVDMTAPSSQANPTVFASPGAGPPTARPAVPSAPTGAPRPSPTSLPGGPSPHRPPQHTPGTQHTPGNLQPQGFHRPADTNWGGGATSRADRIRVFAIAFGATLLVGALAILAVRALTGPDGEDTEAGQGPTDVTASADDTTTTTSGTTTIAEVTTTTSTLDLDGPLVLPLAAADLDLAGELEIEPDESAPSPLQYCDAVVGTDGITEWTGENVAGSVGFPVYYQQLVRFETEAQAEAYVDAYVSSASCEEWTIPTGDGDETATVFPSVSPSVSPTYGDDTQEIMVRADFDPISVYSRDVVVRKQTDVYRIMFTSVSETDLVRLDPLLETAIDVLGY